MSSIETTVSAAADAIVTAETRFQPSSVQKRRWGRSCWKLYSCFGSYKHGSSSKGIGPAAPLSPGPTRPVFVSSIADSGGRSNATNDNYSSSALPIPFTVPPSSPASFLPSDSPSPAEFSHAKPSGETMQIYTIGPYAHDTQLVSPPVFSSAFTTEPSTASYTSPPEPVQTDTVHSSPDVPFAQLLSQYEFQPYHNHLAMSSDSGTSSPFIDEPRRCEPYSYDDDRRVSFELFGEDIPVCIMREAVSAHKCSTSRTEEEASSTSMGCNDEEMYYHYKNPTLFSAGSSQGFNFDGEWWADEDVQSSWGFFPTTTQSGIR